jgi:hypothetical protein
VKEFTAGFEDLASSHHCLGHKYLRDIPFAVLSGVFDGSIAPGELGYTKPAIKEIFIFAVVFQRIRNIVKFNLTNI